jgi:hypothetical protein
MSEHELDKLLGGFAADTLTQEERQKLFTAALQDQQLFNALADEQALKELLADPAVRRRLLQALQQTGTSSAGGSLSWLDWFRRPAGLAFAGGLVAAALAVVLGTKIYQDSLKQSAQSVATEEATPAGPATPAPQASAPVPSPGSEPQAKAKVQVEPLNELAKKNAPLDKTAKRDRTVAPTQEQRASDAARDKLNLPAEQDEARRQAETPAASLSKTAEEVTASADRKLAATPAPSTAVPEPAPMTTQASGLIGGASAPTVSARVLFYGREAVRPDERATTLEKERGMGAVAESAPQANRPERKLEQFALAGKAAGIATQLKPLGLRYSFVIRGSDGLDREVDAATVSKTAGQARVIAEANQDAYLQVWARVGSSTPQLLFPERESGQISVKILVGQRQIISLPIESSPVTLTVRLSRVPFGPITRQEAAMLDRLPPNQLQEAIAPSSPAGSQEQATYVVNQDPSPTAQIAVDIPLGR